MTIDIIANEDARKLVPGFGGRISAALVWDGTDEVRVPEAMGKPREDQMRGTARERLTEVALRVCYDSMGTGRSSEKCHEHIRQVTHYSVTEHAAITVQIEMESYDVLTRFSTYFLNRPSLWVDRRASGIVRATLNPRHLLDWRGVSYKSAGILPGCALGRKLRLLCRPLVPAYLDEIVEGESADVLNPLVESVKVSVIEPETDEEKWVTIYLTGSRGWSHELVRHGDWTAISQRSTRYVDESESEWVLHPLISQFLSEPNRCDIWAEGMGKVGRVARDAYRETVRILQTWLEGKGVDKLSARKQARGAARGMLGNALETEVIFSASVAQWRHMLAMRAADAADAEIRLQFADAVLPCLRASRYGDRFADLELVPASDGIGRSLKGGGHK